MQKSRAAGRSRRDTDKGGRKMNDVLRADPGRFNPFREGNVLPKLRAGRTIRDSSLTVYAASAFFPVAGAILQSVFEPSAFREENFRKYSTMDGYKALIEGRCDIFIATAPSKSQREEMDRSGFSFREIVLCREPLAFLANRENPVDGLKSAQVRAMYEGSLTSWREAGGDDLPVTPYQLEAGNGSRSAFARITEAEDPDRQVEVRTMPEMVDEVAKNPGGISYTFWSYYMKMYANRRTKLLNIDDRGPTADDYPFVFPLYLFSREDNEKPAVRKLCEFVTTEEGREIIRRGNLCWRSV